MLYIRRLPARRHARGSLKSTTATSRRLLFLAARDMQSSTRLLANAVTLPMALEAAILRMTVRLLVLYARPIPQGLRIWPLRSKRRP